MEGDAMEMSRDELQSWIRDEVTQSELISPDVLEKCNLLQSLLERRKKQAADLVELCESVAVCEETVKKLYCRLGWEYSDTDSDNDGDDDDDNDDPTGTNYCSPPASQGRAPLSPTLGNNDNPQRHNGEKEHHILTKELMVVLTRLPASRIAKALRRPTPQRRCSDDESLSGAESDQMWEPEEDSSGSDFSLSNFNSSSNKRRKINRKNGKRAASRASRTSGAKSNGAETSTPTASKDISAEKTVTKTSTPQASASTNEEIKTTETPLAKANTNANSQQTKTSTMPPSTKESTSTTIKSTDCQSPTKAPPEAPKKEISVNMTVLARRRTMCWQRGTVIDLIDKQGKVKYKVNFEEKGKSLVSGHHVAFDCMPKVEQLFVGARVVVKSPSDESQFLPGTLAEVPCRRNRMRFLVFTDDHRPVYVGLPVLRLVYKPLPDPLDDIKDDNHRCFMKEYMRSWPYPPQTQYKVGQTTNAEFDGVQQKCEVVLLDSSLIEVVFKKDQHKEWLYRGSIRLKHMVDMKQRVEKQIKNQATSADGSSTTTEQ
ncbi:histone-lysine N-methyltransferase SETDB1-B-like [Stegastes partitus]|uniref:Histone-lysine N-methyltransferase SETDB1-B-like n=1 Tax=Stegastes partitus TaxID=144197 RepID=A0A9Y4JQ51_9TELE|nr:PREDICTED: histone-lysine N-methyltransferase SETDB1-B-like [Stegastes partitus]